MSLDERLLGDVVPSRSGREETAWAGVVAAGGTLGVLSRLGDDLSAGWAWIANIGGPWLVLAFALGASAGSRRVAVRRGAIGLLSAVGAYYAWIGAVEHGAGRDHLLAVSVLWAVVGLGAGAGFGAGGWWWRAGPRLGRLVGAGLLSAALVGEAAVLLKGQPAGPQAVLLAELAVGGALPWVLLRHPGEVARSAAVAVLALPVAMVAAASVLALAARLAS